MVRYCDGSSFTGDVEEVELGSKLYSSQFVHCKYVYTHMHKIRGKDMRVCRFSSYKLSPFSMYLGGDSCL